MKPLSHLSSQFCILNFPNTLFQQSTAQAIRSRNQSTDCKDKMQTVKNLCEEQRKERQKEMLIKNGNNRTIKSLSQEKFSKQRCRSLRVLNKQSPKENKGKLEKCEIGEVKVSDKSIGNAKIKGNQLFMKPNNASENKNYSLECNIKRKKFNLETVQQHYKAQFSFHQRRHSNFERTKSSNEIGKVFESEFNFQQKQKIILHVEQHLKDHCTGQCCLSLNQTPKNKKANKNWFQKFIHEKPVQETTIQAQKNDNLNNHDILNEQNSFELIKQSLHSPYQNVVKTFSSEKKIGFSFSCENRFKQSMSTTCAVQMRNLRKNDQKIYQNDNIAFGANRHGFRERVSTKVKEPLGKFYTKFEKQKQSTNSAILLKSNIQRFPNEQKKYFGPDFYDISNKQNSSLNNLPCHYFLSQIPKGTVLPKEDNREFYSEHPLGSQKKKTISKVKFQNEATKDHKPNSLFSFPNQIPKNTLGKKQRKVDFSKGLKNKKYESSTTNVSPRKIQKWIPTYSTVGQQQSLIYV